MKELSDCRGLPGPAFKGNLCPTWHAPCQLFSHHPFWHHLGLGVYFPQQLTIADPKKGTILKAHFIFQPSIFRGMPVFEGVSLFFRAYVNFSKCNAAKELVAKPSPYLPTYICTVLSDGTIARWAAHDPCDVRIY